MPRCVELIRSGTFFHVPDFLWPYAVVLGVEHGWEPRRVWGLPADLSIRTAAALTRTFMRADEAAPLAAALERALPFVPDKDCRAALPVGERLPRVATEKDWVGRFNRSSSEGASKVAMLAESAAELRAFSQGVASRWSGPRKELLRRLIVWCQMGGAFSIFEYDRAASPTEQAPPKRS